MTTTARLRRPGSRRTRGVVACVAATLLLGGCGDGPVDVAAPELPSRDRAACEQLVGHLPGTLAGEDARDISPAEAPGAAWGDPAIVLTCGVEEPADFTDTSTCVQVDRVGWFVPDEVLLDDDESRDVTMTAVGYRPRVQVRVPGDYRPEGFAAVAAVIGKLVERDLERVARCR